MTDESWEPCAYCVPIVFCFLIRDHKALLIRRAREPYKGEVTIPGGRKQRGESLRAACAREMLEETGYVVGRLDFAGILHVLRDGEDREYVSYYFTCSDFSGELRESGEGSLLWADLDESLTLRGIHPFYVRLLPYIRNGVTVDLTLRVFSDGASVPMEMDIKTSGL